MSTRAATMMVLGFIGTFLCRMAFGFVIWRGFQISYRITENFGSLAAMGITVNELRVSAGAGFVVVICGNIVTMPGLPKVPAAERIKILPSGKPQGLT